MVLSEVEQGVWAVVKQGWQLYFECFRRIWPLMLVSSVVGTGVGWLQIQNPGDIDSSLGYSLLILVVSGYLNAILTLICLEHLLQKSVSIRDMAGPALRKLPMLVVVLVIFIFAFVIGLLLFLIPGFILMVTLFPAATLFVIRPMGAVGAINESHQLVWGNYWRTANVYSLLTLTALIALIPVLILAATGEFGGLSLKDRGNLASGFIMPWITGALTTVNLVLIHDLLLRKRGQSLAEYTRGV